MSTAILNKKIYCFGGLDTPKEVFCLNIPSLELQTIRPMHESRIYCAAIGYNGLLFVVGGGISATDTKVGKCHDSVEFYDPKLSKWFEASKMNENRLAPCLAVLDGYLYVAGKKGAHLKFEANFSFNSTYWFFKEASMLIWFQLIQ